jgi:hypothetical protein
MNSLPLSHRAGQTAAFTDSVQCASHVFSTQTLSHIDGQAFARMAIGHREHAQLAPVEELVRDEVHAPYLIDLKRHLLGLTQLGCLVAPGALKTQRQTFLAIRPVHALDVVLMAFAPEHHVHAAVAIVHAPE